MLFNEIQDLFTRFCQTQGIPTIEFDASESATLPVGNDGMVLHIQYRRDTEDVVLLAPLGELPDDTATYVLETLLAANLYWQATSGATLAWSIELSQPVLQFAIPSENMTEQLLATTMADYLDVADGWRKKIAALATARPRAPELDDNEDDEDEPEEFSNNSEFLKV